MAEAVLGEAVASTLTVPPQQEAMPCKYGYPLFAGPGGERYLKKLLRHILPAALYRIWEIFVEHQAQGNECFLSLMQLAILAGRSLRTIQRGVASLQARGLLVERAEWKTFLTTEGSPISRVVIVKDFAALYALAVEYDAWLHADDYIPPQRCFARILMQNPALVAKLRRFDIYRKILYTRVPGPGRQPQEEDRWFTQYRTDAAGTPSHEAAADQLSQVSVPAPNLTAKERSKKESLLTPKRITESSQRDNRRGDSCDSASSFSAQTVREADPPSRRWPSSPGRQEEKQKQWVARVPQEPTRPEQQPRNRATPGNEHAEVRQTVRTGRAARGCPPQVSPFPPAQASTGTSPSTSPPDHPLARSFLNEIVVPFGDRNPKGSTTRVLNMLARASLDEAEVLLCLVRAYTIARDTHTIHSAHVDPGTGRANRMPLFCTLLERFVQARLHNDRWNYSWQQVEDDLAADDRLRLWWIEHQTLLAQNPFAPFEQQTPPVSDAFKDQDDEEPSRVMGWANQEAAHYWGEQLLEALIMAGYKAEVRVHLEDQWYQILLVGDGCQWVLTTTPMVLETIKALKQVDCNVVTNE